MTRRLLLAINKRRGAIPCTTDLADDQPHKSVVVHSLEWCERQGLLPQAVCCLYATAPFVRPADLVAGYQLLDQAPAIARISQLLHSPSRQRAIHIDASGRSVMLIEHFNTRSQDLEEAHHDAGQFYWARPEAWMHSAIALKTDALSFFLDGVSGY